jgi:DNA repair exonuclease SbcCD ATPase subunit
MQEITIKSTKFINFLSYGNTWNEINFEDNLSTFISGYNTDTGGANGCGKTVLFQSLVYGLYNKSITNISLQRLINSTNDIKNTLMEVIVVFSKVGIEYKVHRKRGAETTVILYRDGIDITPDSVIETDTLIEQILGVSYDIFSKFIVFSGSSVPFLDLPVSQQRTHIEELFNITILTEKANKLKKIIQNTDSDIKVEEALIKEKENNINAYKNRLKFAEQKVISWEDNKEEAISEITKDLISIKDVDFEKEQLLFDKKLELTERINNFSRELIALTRDVKQKKQNFEKYSNELSHLESSECPYCNQKYKANKTKITELKNSVETLKKEIA